MNEIMNPYGEVAKRESGGDVESSRAEAEVKSMVVMAKRFPRDPIAATDRILNECQRPKLAEQALYSYSRGGTDITGPSIRLAEAISRNWGNLDSGVKELSNDGEQSEMMSYCWDMESNVRSVKVFSVKHWRDTKKGGYRLTDSRDIYEATANNAARRLRAVILSVIPSDVVDAAVAQCEATLKASADTSPEAIKKMLGVFEKFNVNKKMIEDRIQRKIESITPAQMVSLRKIYNSMNDGMSVAADWFAMPTATTSDESEALTEKIKGKKQDPKPEPPK